MHGRLLFNVIAGVYIDDLVCMLDPRINATTLASYQNGKYLKQINQYLWKASCGRARGVFTLAMNSDEFAGFFVFISFSVVLF
jgi:hypothetical protein